MKYGISILCLLLVLTSTACVNLNDYNLHGYPIDHVHQGSFLKHIVDDPGAQERKKSNRETLVLFERDHAGRWNRETASDYAALLIMDMQLEKAKNILDTLLRNNSADYSLNANYGTLMELMGQTRQALRFIQKAVHINAESHAGSEWIHVRILEARLQLEHNPQWLNRHHVIEKDLSRIKTPEDATNMINALLYQLQERTYFVAPENDIVSDLLYTTGQLALRYDRGVVLARNAFKCSLLYGPLRQSECEALLADLLLYPNEYSEEQETFSILLRTGCFVFILLLTVSFIQSKRKKTAQKPRF